MIEILLGCVCVHLFIIGVYLDKIARALNELQNTMRMMRNESINMVRQHEKESDARLAIMDYIGSVAECKVARDGAEGAMRAIETAPTADVVPKSEYDEVLSNWQKIHDSYTADCIDHYNKGRQEVAREIFTEIEELAKTYTFPVVKNGVVEIAKEPFWCIEPNDLAELKKKYTEGEG